MARKYRKIDPRIWHDEKFAQLSPEEKLIAIYCLTGPQSNRIGIFPMSLAAGAENTGTLPETFRERFGNVCETLNWTFDAACRVLYLPTWWRYQRPDNPNVFAACLDDADDVPECQALQRFKCNCEYLPETFAKRLGERFGVVTPNVKPQEQEQEQKQDQEQIEDSSVVDEQPREPATDDPAVLEFPTNGKPRAWVLRQSRVDELRELYPGVDVIGECRKALAWCQAAGNRRKTSSGMPRFLVNWLNRANDSGGNRGSPSSRQPSGRQERLAAVRDRLKVLAEEDA